ncbi:heme utilization protein HutZ [Vibrio vulnificus]|jgi:heme utilization protein HutZ|uniref:Heme utilization protein HutZ n=3 Tax=Vibrio vulnificus TaxID=672 RepID=A0A1V8MEV4_VIBVL|nr:MULTISPECIES: heme utilization protein HutZ [Vibrio]EWS68903.1 HugZ protein [Vibrio vulnificus BAA87]OJI58350.1 Pyridoxamine 5'-phosphate oxidase [Vibrio fluvialis]AAO08476.1 Pyridoxamine 5'-phosphate oxidase-related putative heme iron utilization protein [Vibrio vulnificus CMCP6]ADV88406.1 pyridoxamine 5'-phosphate oxidase-related putative heme iron utilization protein [Vibrio vulnificus MO6-24/O]AIL72475.1 heme iron utilization protein [Vibrio vulnificus]
MDQQVKQERLQGRLEPEIKEFRQERQTLQLATVDADGRPNVSYAPFVQNQEGYFVLISKIARHARNLLENPQVSLMMIEDEEGAKQLFARKRLTFDAVASVIERDTQLWHQVITQMEERFGEIVSGLSQLEDFVLFNLKAERGLFVKGFGQAYQVSGDDLVDFVHLQEGHRKISNG